MGTEVASTAQLEPSGHDIVVRLSKEKTRTGTTGHIASQSPQETVLAADIVISAFNEERCVADVLRDLSLSWEPEWLHIQNIYVISDASTDQTEEIVERLGTSDGRIKLVRKPQRKGKQDSINLALSTTDADIVVFVDADVRFATKFSLAKLIRHFRNRDREVALVQGGLIRIRPGFTLNPATLAAYFDWVVVDKVRRQRPMSWWSIDGRVMALSRDFYQHLMLPRSLADDQFIFYSCVRQGREFVWAEDAIFFYGSPESIADFSRQWSRYFFYTRQSVEFFGKHLVTTDMRAPGLWRTIASRLLHHPLCGLMWVLCYARSKAEYARGVDFARYQRGFFWTKSSALKLQAESLPPPEHNRVVADLVKY